MNVFIENGTYGLWNVGDLVMLRLTAQRILTHFPNAHINIVTRDNRRLAQFIDNVHGIAPADWNAVYQRSPKLRRMKRALRSFAFALTRKFTKQDKELEKWVRHSGSTSRSSWNFISRLYHADAVIASGGGYMNDHFVADAVRILRTFELAQKMGKKTAMFGQGFGPAMDDRLLAIAKKVLPALDLIAIRDGAGSLQFLRNLGVDMSRVIVTGDDALEPASALTPGFHENILGLNVRVAWYSGFDDTTAKLFCQAVAKEAEKLNADIRAIGIGISKREYDAGRVKAFIPYAAEPQADTPEGVIQAVGKCRLMVTGSFHTAVFALAQGIPAVAAVNSDYYAEKFHGLAKQFGSALRIVPAADFVKLRQAIHDLWQPDTARTKELHAKTHAQISLSQQAYEKFFAMLETTTPTRTLVTS